MLLIQVCFISAVHDRGVEIESKMHGIAVDKCFHPADADRDSLIPRLLPIFLHKEGAGYETRMIEMEICRYSFVE